MKNMNLRLRLIVFFVLISTAVFLTAGAVSWFECREKIDEFLIRTKSIWQNSCLRQIGQTRLRTLRKSVTGLSKNQKCRRRRRSRRFRRIRSERTARFS